MFTPEACIARAEEAERLAALVSYERDRARLTRQAAEWRALAAEPSQTRPVEERTPRPTMRDRLTRVWRRRDG